MIPTSLDGTRGDWIRRGIVEWFHASGFDVTITRPVRAWLAEHVGTSPKDWWWDDFKEEGEVAIYFTNPSSAVLFKLTWL